MRFRRYSTRGVRDIQSLFPDIETGTDPLTPPDLTPDTEFLPLFKQPRTCERTIRTTFGDSTLKTGYLYYSGERPALKVVTQSGRKLIGSSTHPVLVMGTRKGKVEYVPLSHLREYHSILGVISDSLAYPFIHDDDGGRERVRSMAKEGISYKEVLSLSSAEQIYLVAERLMAECLLSHIGKAVFCLQVL